MSNNERHIENFQIVNMASSFDARIQGDCRRCGTAFSKNIDYVPAGFCPNCTGKNDRNQDVLTPHQKKHNLTSKLFPNPEKFCRRNISPTSQTKISVSKKPLRCLFPECGKFVGVFDIGAHYRYEHKEVPHIQTYFDARNALEFSPKEINRRGVHTMLLFDLNYSSTNAAENSSREKLTEIFPKKNPTLLVLATKLTEYDMEEKIRDKNISHSAEEIKDTDKWIFWLGSNISTNVSYTIAVSSLGNDTRLKYFGPIVHIEEDPVDLFDSGRCLPLSRFQIERMSGNFQKNMNLDVIIYSED